MLLCDLRSLGGGAVRKGGFQSSGFDRRGGEGLLPVFTGCTDLKRQEASLCFSFFKNHPHSFPAYRFISAIILDSICCCSVAQLCLTLCYLMDSSMPGLPVSHHFLEFAQIHINCIVMPSNHLILCRPLLLSPSIFPNSFPMSLFFTSGGQSIGTSASASVLPMNIQGWFPIGLTGLILLSKELSESSPAP